MNKRLAIIGGVTALAVVGLAALSGAAGGRSETSVAPAIGDGFASDEGSDAVGRVLGRGGAAGQAPFSLPANASSEKSVASAPAIAPRPPAPGSANDAVAGGGATTMGAPAATIDDRKIVQTASLRLQVKEVGGSYEEVGRIATGAGGFVASSNFALQGEQQVASVTIRVPSARLPEVLTAIRGLGARIDSESSNANDITEEYSDLGARLRTLEATETQLLQFLSQAKTVSEVLQVQDRLNSVRTQIEQVKGRVVLLDKLSDLGTLTVHLRPLVAVAKTDGGDDLGQRVAAAWQDSLDFLGGIAGDVVAVIVFSWWLLFLAVPAVIIGQRLRSRPQVARPAAYD